MKNVVRVAIYAASDIGEYRSPATVTFKDRLSQMYFQGPDMHAYRRLGDCERGGGAAERAGINDTFENFQLSERYGKHIEPINQ
jgi:hypothetical protein